jgi:hypothetical protein
MELAAVESATADRRKELPDFLEGKRNEIPSDVACLEEPTARGE